MARKVGSKDKRKRKLRNALIAASIGLPLTAAATYGGYRLPEDINVSVNKKNRLLFGAVGLGGGLAVSGSIYNTLNQVDNYNGKKKR